MARGSKVTDVTTLQMALIGYEVQREKINERIRELQSALKGKQIPSAAAGESKAAGGKRVLSAAARRRIAAAQKKRWAEHRRRKAAEAKKSA